MIRKTLACLAVFTVLLLPFAGAAGEYAGEEADLVPATPTDLDCLHEHVKETIYFFETPLYTRLNSFEHRVSGPATVETACLDCGEILSSEVVRAAEEIRPHSMKRGVCVLCGYQAPVRNSPDAEDLPGEQSVYAFANAEIPDIWALTLTCRELGFLEQEGVQTALIRADDPAVTAAVALDVAGVLEQARPAESDLNIAFAERSDGSVFASVRLDPPADPEAELTGVTLRLYRPETEEVRAAVAPANGSELLETEILRDAAGFWSVAYAEEGTYFILP